MSEITGGNPVFSLFADCLHEKLDGFKVREKTEYHDVAKDVYTCKKCGEPTVKFIMMYHNVKPVYARCTCGCGVWSGVESEYNKTPESKEEHEENIYRGATLKRTTVRNPHIGKTLESCDIFCMNIGKFIAKRTGLYITGKKNSGKTHMVSCIYNHFKECKITSLQFISLPNLENNLKDKITGQKTEGFVSSDLLIIDDFKGFQGKAFELSFLGILKERIKNKKLIVFASEYKISELPVCEDLKKLINSYSRELLLS